LILSTKILIFPEFPPKNENKRAPLSTIIPIIFARYKILYYFCSGFLLITEIVKYDTVFATL
jgi:hypothetical protein